MFLTSLANQLIRKRHSFCILSIFSIFFKTKLRAMLAVKNVTHTGTVRRERNVDLQILETRKSICTLGYHINSEMYGVL